MHTRRLRVHNLPHAAAQLSGSTVVVIDLLRASSTICQALAAGAIDVVPFRDVTEALSAAADVPRETVVLGGERGGKRIDGFDLGNSPREYTLERVGGKRVFLTTTNGTQALWRARMAQRIVVGSILNLSAVAESIRNEPRLNVLCAGTDGRETAEDILAAGAIVYQGAYQGTSLAAERQALNQAAARAQLKWQRLLESARISGRGVNEELAIALRDTPGGRNLLAIGLEQDLEDCAQVDRLTIVPELDVREWRITVPHGGKSAC
jgi:2-phosphosulfolactate phosphatase